MSTHADIALNYQYTMSVSTKNVGTGIAAMQLANHDPR